MQDKYPSVPQTTEQQIENNFTYHAPKDDQSARYVLLRDAAKQLVHLIVSNSVQSRERALAVTKLEECIFWANAGIARNE